MKATTEQELTMSYCDEQCGVGKNGGRICEHIIRAATELGLSSDTAVDLGVRACMYQNQKYLVDPDADEAKKLSNVSFFQGNGKMYRVRMPNENDIRSHVELLVNGDKQ